MSIMRNVMPPPIVKLRREFAGRGIDIDLSQGVPYFGPPQEEVRRLLEEPHSTLSRYTPDEGLPELLEVVRVKLKRENGIDAADGEVVATPGANYGFFIALSSILERGEKVALTSPYYFNHLMAIEMLGGVPHILPWHGERFNVEEIQNAMELGVKVLVLVNPSNPTGVVLNKKEVKAAIDIVEESGAWLISDETYEHFLYSGREHISPATLAEEDRVITLFTMSKSFGMGGWRVGYIHYPRELQDDILKAHDTVGICAPRPSQLLAKRLLEDYSPSYPRSKAEELQWSLRNFTEMLVGKGIKWVGGEGAFYILVKAPSGLSGWDVARELLQNWRIAVVPGEPFGADGFFRVSFGNIPPRDSERSARGLAEALEAIYSKFEGKGLK